MSGPSIQVAEAAKVIESTQRDLVHAGIFRIRVLISTKAPCVIQTFKSFWPDGLPMQGCELVTRV